MAFPSNTVESALARLRAGTGTPDQFLRALAEGDLWVPLPAGTDAAGAAQLPVMILDGQPYVAVYTSAEQYEHGAGQLTRMVIRGRELAGMMDERLGLAVNPGGDVGLPVRPDGVRGMRAGPITIPAGQRVRLGQPAEEPHALLTTVVTALGRIPAVVEARRALAQFGDQPPGLLIGVRTDGQLAGDRQAVLAAINSAVSTAPVSLTVDTVFLDDPSDQITAWMIDHTEPFYRRTDPTP